MENSEYHIKIYSRSRMLIAFVVIFCSSSVFFKDNIPKDNNFLSVSLLIGTFISSISSFYLAALIASAKIKVVFTNKAFFHIWERRFLLSWEKDLEIPWNNVDKCFSESDRAFDSIIVYLKNKI